ncbi:MAG: Holliday junction resolvase Hjc [Candidatus Micrarchaeia archaeon]
MLRYSKGARSERELLNILHEKRFSVVRAAGSGVNALSPDVIAAKNGKAFVFECKAWDKGSISIPNEKIESLLSWEKDGNMQAVVAWRMNGSGWFFIRPTSMTKTGKNYTITKKAIGERGFGMDFFEKL